MASLYPWKLRGGFVTRMILSTLRADALRLQTLASSLDNVVQITVFDRIVA
jgi:hypothetical protein